MTSALVTTKAPLVSKGDGKPHKRVTSQKNTQGPFFGFCHARNRVCKAGFFNLKFMTAHYVQNFILRTTCIAMNWESKLTQEILPGPMWHLTIGVTETLLYNAIKLEKNYSAWKFKLCRSEIKRPDGESGVR